MFLPVDVACGGTSGALNAIINSTVSLEIVALNVLEELMWDRKMLTVVRIIHPLLDFQHISLCREHRFARIT